MVERSIHGAMPASNRDSKACTCCLLLMLMIQKKMDRHMVCADPSFFILTMPSVYVTLLTLRFLDERSATLPSLVVSARNARSQPSPDWLPYHRTHYAH